MWKDPVLDIPIPAPDRDERTAADAARQKLLIEIVNGERAAGAEVTQDRVEKLAALIEAQPFRLVGGGAPLTLDAIEKKIIAEEAALTMEASYCRACRTPEDRLKSALCQACYSQRRRWLDLAETEMADDHAFDQRIQAGVRQGIIFRMASPLWCKDRPRHVHEDDVA